MTYTFRNRFRLPEGDRLDAEATEVKLADSADEGLVTLKPVREEGIAVRGNLNSRSDELILQGSGYVDASAAAEAGRRWRQYLAVALAREGTGVDLGSGDGVAPTLDKVFEGEPPALLQRIGTEAGHRVVSDGYQLLVFKSEPVPKFINLVAGVPTINISGRLDRLAHTTNAVRQQDHYPWDRRKALSYRLVHLALADSNLETKHIQLVTAIEVLLEQRNRPQDILDAIDKLIAEVAADWSDGDVKRRMADILHQSKEESITRIGSTYVASTLKGTYDGSAPAKFFKLVYGMRSGLVHGEKPKKPRPTIDQVGKIAAELVRFVLDLLDADQPPKV